MQDDPELQMNDAWQDENTYSPKRTRIGANRNRLLPVLIGILVVALLAGGIFYFITGRSAHKEVDPIQAKMAAFEQKIASLERQITDLQGKAGTAGPDPLLVQRLDALTQKVDALERRPQPQAESKTKPAPSKPVAATEKRYHTVQKGETLTRISKTYGISVERLRKLNNLWPDRPVKTGQKLLVSPAQ